MSGSEKERLTYPSPAIVVGIGKFGLSVLERIGEDWEELHGATDDPSHENLRLVHVRPDPDSPTSAWREGEKQFVRIARHTGDGDLPTLALNFVILRSMGLIRYRNGSYQLAVPRDEGVAELHLQAQVEGKARLDSDDEFPADFARRRYFEWMNLSPDPISSVERLRVLMTKHPEVDLFVTPLVNRIRHGHSPQATIACISRCNAFAEGRDPTPFGWLAGELRDETNGQPPTDGYSDLGFEPNWLFPTLTNPRKPRPGRKGPTPQLMAGAEFVDSEFALAAIAEEPLPGFVEWSREVCSNFAQSMDLPGALAAGDDESEAVFNVCVPSTFWASSRDLPSPLAPTELLRVDWEATGWATSEDSHMVQFQPLRTSEFRLGLFDHDRDASKQRGIEANERLGQRLRELSIHVHRGLVRMWVDLQRERVESPEEESPNDRYRDAVDEAVVQSLELLGELLVRPLMSDSTDGVELNDSDPELFADFPAEASAELRFNSVRRDAGSASVDRQLRERLKVLGFEGPVPGSDRSPLLREIVLSPDDLPATGAVSAAVDPDELDERSEGLLELRGQLNQIARELYDFSFLRRYHSRPEDAAPRLSIYVVLDVSEPFSRAVIRPMLREIHAELLRALSPIFETYRQGFDRTLMVTPIFWMPHPADSYGGRYPTANRGEEAAIIEAVQGVRKWVETVPRGKRCIPQLFVNSRVTDNAVLSVWDSIRQTRDFLTFQLRNDLGRDSWLRHTVTGPRGDDFLATFSCHAVDFPAERSREYLANRLARHALRRVKYGDKGAPDEIEALDVGPPPEDVMTRVGRSTLEEKTRPLADRIRSRVTNRTEIEPNTTTEDLVRLFDESFARELKQSIADEWRSFTARRGDMDKIAADVRKTTWDELQKTLADVQETGRQLIDDYAKSGGLDEAYAGFDRLEQDGKENLQETERLRQEREQLCRKHQIPDTKPIDQRCESVVDAAKEKPEGPAMTLGLVLWAFLSPVLGAPLSWAIAMALELHLDPNVAEIVLGPLGPIVGGLLVFLPVFFLLRRHMNWHVENVQEQVDSLADEASRVVHGGATPMAGRASVRSFLESRLRHASALSSRQFSRQVYERTLRDLTLAERLQRSIDIQVDLLGRHAEGLGVQVEMTDVEAQESKDEVGHLFDSRSPVPSDRLINPECLLDYYDRKVGNDNDVDKELEQFIEAAGGFDDWRETASFADSEAILNYTRRYFDELVMEPVADQFVFREVVKEHFLRFVESNHSNIGFGAKFTGYEGLDPDGISVLARAELVVPRGLDRLFEDACSDPEAPPRLKSIRIRTVPVDPNTAFILSLAQGIRPHSLRNLRRFESFHHRAQMPDDRTFPLSGDTQREKATRPINHLSGFGSLSGSIHAQLRSARKALESDLEYTAAEEQDGG